VVDPFTIERIAPMELAAKSPLAEMYTLSPFVWPDHDRFELLLRAVNHSDIAAEKVSRIYYGRSDDGVRFTMGDSPVIAPGPGDDDDDKDGCEDPTVAVVDGTTYAYYSGWNQTTKKGQLLLASGPDAERLRKRGVAIPYSNDIMNPKEATIAPVADGTWRLFFEYAADGASKVGLASAPSVDGPWTVQAPPFEARPGGWDGWHLSPEPVLSADPERPIMLYNGATRDTKWRIGWIAFDAGFTRVVDRGVEPLIVPPPPPPGSDDTDIAFAASAVEQDGAILLYYSVADKDLLCATLRRLDSR